MTAQEANQEVPQEEVKPRLLDPIRLPDMQTLIVTFADGRRGVFAGPAIISAAELKLAPPQLVSIDFSEPRPMGITKPVEEKPADPVIEVKEVVSENQGS